MKIALRTEFFLLCGSAWEHILFNSYLLYIFIMKIIRAAVLGFCFGVRRAVETAEKAIEENSCSEESIYTLGPLVHNPLVMDSLLNRGVQVIDESSFGRLNSSSVVIIRAHGTTPAVIENLERHKVKILDATCPKVHLSQKRAKEWSEKGYRIVIAGDKNHGEVLSISSYSNNNYVVIENLRQAMDLVPAEKNVLIAQTTFSPNEFEKIKKVMMEKDPEIQVFNSICSATMERQEALVDLKGKADGIIVIGGRNSANTKRLYETACSICEKVALIEDVSEIPAEFLELETVALTAGASTPDSVIDNAELFLKRKKNDIISENLN